MKVRRDIASLPVRSARETWDAISKLITGRESIDKEQLTAAASIVSAAIADEHAAVAPIVVKGVGRRLVIYTVHGPDAMEHGPVIEPLTWNPTAGSAWRITVPCDAEDVEWMSEALRSRASRVSVHDVNVIPVDDDREEPQHAAEVVINWGALAKR